ncbi:MAG: C40 family peptidase [Ottowia sp.]|uniref:C40 family peptidase n=1 Tax=Ottowia sp. TaxID=1898956 RepID=UPI003C72A448
MTQQPTSLDRRLWLLGAAGAALLAGCGTPAPRRTASRSQPAVRSAPSLALDTAEREAAVARAMLVVNTPYRYGGNTIEGGFDCSGLVHYVFTDLGNSRLPRSTEQWAAASTPVPEESLQRGDLVFFNTTGKPWSHMGIYVGNGQFVHAPSTGGTVRKDSLSSRYFASRYLGARSVFAAQ